MRMYEREFTNPFFCMQVVVNHPYHKEDIEPFCSHTLKICLVREGRGVWEIGGRSYPIEKGDIFLLSNNESRKVTRVEQPCDMKFLILEFEPRFIWSDNEDMLESGYLSIFFDRTEEPRNRMDGASPAAKEIGTIILRVQRELEQKKAEYKLMVKVSVLNILVLIKRHFSSQLPEKNNFISLENKELLEKAMDYINEHYQKDINLSDITQVAFMSQSQFSRLFQKYNGIGYSQYVMRIRVQHAVDLLFRTDQTVLDIALQCGFHNATNFYKAFRKVTNKMPKDFRR